MPLVLHLVLAAVPALLGLAAAAVLAAGIARGKRDLFARGLALLLGAALAALPATLSGWPAWSAVEFTDGYSAVHAARHRTAGVVAAGAAVVAAAAAWCARRQMSARGGIQRALALTCLLLAGASALSGAWAVVSGWQVRRPELRRYEAHTNQLPVEIGTPRVGSGPPPQD
jgi:hypothetical protein